MVFHQFSSLNTSLSLVYHNNDRLDRLKFPDLLPLKLLFLTVHDWKGHFGRNSRVTTQLTGRTRGMSRDFTGRWFCKEFGIVFPRVCTDNSLIEPPVNNLVSNNLGQKSQRLSYLDSTRKS